VGVSAARGTVLLLLAWLRGAPRGVRGVVIMLDDRAPLGRMT
jgi:hypothetical protein